MMNKLSARRVLSVPDVSQAVARLMPNIIRGVQLDFFVKKGVTQTQFLILIAIHAHEHCPMSLLARNMHVSLPTTTGIVARLVRAGYVRRAAHPNDRRQVIVALTPRGQAFIRQFQGVIRRRWEEVLKPLAPSELGAFYHVITTLREQLQVRR